MNLWELGRKAVAGGGPRLYSPAGPDRLWRYIVTV